MFVCLFVRVLFLKEENGKKIKEGKKRGKTQSTSFTLEPYSAHVAISPALARNAIQPLLS